MSGLLAIDPGTKEFGWALWHSTRRRLRAPDAAGVCKAGGAWWQDRVHDLVDYFLGRIPHCQLGIVAIEWPHMMSGDAGTAAAAHGDLEKLAYFCGYLAKMLRDSYPRILVDLVPVREWKGQLKKEITVDRLSQAIGLHDGRGNEIITHAWDAVGVGLHYLGFGINCDEIAERMAS